MEYMMLKQYMKALNDIEDYFEYSCESSKDKDKVHSITAELVKELEDIIEKGNIDPWKQVV